MKIYDLGIIGGSASGLVAAINAKRLHPEMKIAVFEQLPRLGKKILATGNGRCNMTNMNAAAHTYRNDEFVKSVFEKYPPEKVIDFFSSLGLLTYCDESGRVYPRSNTAASVLDCLRFEIDNLNIDIFTEYKAERISVSDDGMIVNDSFLCNKLIIASGGKASPSQGSDGSMYPVLKKLGHTITTLVPSLVPLNSRPEKIKSVKGLRASNVILTLEGKRNEYSSKGEILFTDTGVSGIAAMELASFAERELRNGFDPVLHIDFIPETDEIKLADYVSSLIEIKKGQLLENLLTGILPKQIGVMLMKNAGIYISDARIDIMSDNMISLLVNKIKDFSLDILGTRGFANAQVTSGGIDVSEICSDTMKSEIISNLYICGEIADVDGGCGGFNLQWAFASGLLAGELND